MFLSLPPVWEASEWSGDGFGCGRPPERQGNKRYRSGAEMVIQREPREHRPENGGNTKGKQRREKRELTDGRSWRQGVRETVSPPPGTEGRTERHTRGRRLKDQARPGAGDGGRDYPKRCREARTDQKAAKKARDKKEQRREWREAAGAGRAQRSGRGRREPARKSRAERGNCRQNR